MTVTVDVGRDAATARIPTGAPKRARRPANDEGPVEFWPTAAIREALETDDLTVWQRIVVAIKRDPYGRTARQVEEVLESTRPYGVSKALSEVLTRTRDNLEANERAEVAARFGCCSADPGSNRRSSRHGSVYPVRNSQAISRARPARPPR